MAFCNSCGATLQSGAKACPKCGTAVPEGVLAPTVQPAPPVKPQSNALKTVLIVVAAVIVLGILAIGAATFVGLRIAHHTRVESRDGNARVETPFGTVESTDDPKEASRNLGVDLYPGARVLKGNSANMGGMHTVEAELESDDPVQKVAAYYKSKFPNAKVSVADNDHYTLVSTDNKNLITINIEEENGKTRINVATVSGKHVTGSKDSSD